MTSNSSSQSSSSGSTSTTNITSTNSRPVQTTRITPTIGSLPVEENDGKNGRKVILDEKIGQNMIIHAIDSGEDFKKLKHLVTHTHESDQNSFNIYNINDIKSGVINSALKLYAYIGFSPLLCRLRVESQEKDKKVLVDDLTEITTLILSRGTKFDKIFKNVKKEAIERGQSLTRKYGYSKKAKSPHTITLARHTHTFPDLCVIVLFKNKDIRILGDVPDRYPRHLCFPGAPAIFPDEKKEEFMKGYLAWNANFSSTIKSNQSSETILRFANLSLNSPLFTTHKRYELLNSLEEED